MVKTNIEKTQRIVKILILFLGGLKDMELKIGFKLLNNGLEKNLAFSALV